MADNYFPLEGDRIDPNSCGLPKIKELIRFLEADISPYVSLVECQRSVDQLSETIVLEVEVELPQRKVHDIHRFERISVSFDKDDRTYPEVLALREDFPIVPHRNLREKERPLSMCLYEEPYADVKLRWEALGFIECIREWLALTAKGKLHADDQPLEPLYFHSLKNHLVIPHDLFPIEVEMTELLFIKEVKRWTEGRALIIVPEKEISESDYFGVATAFQCNPQTHGIISHHPTDFEQLCEITSRADFDLVNELRNRLKSALMADQIQNLAEKGLVLIISFPKRRISGGEIEISDIWGFVFENQIKEIGTDLGIWDVSEGIIGQLIPPDPNRNGEGLALTLLSPVDSFSRKQAAQLNGITIDSNPKIATIGLGALGSHIFLNLIRSGFGEWVLIDYDFLLPHNLARHVLPGAVVGFPKAEALSAMANLTIDGDPISAYLIEDVLRPEHYTEELKKIFDNADVILDASASIAVARKLSDDPDLKARCISLYFSPSGNDLVILAESTDRAIKLDLLEMQYYRYIIGNEGLSDHLLPADRKVRYANSCRDISAIVSQDMVSLHSSIASASIKKILNSAEASLSIWRADKDSFTVQQFSSEPCQPIVHHIGEWKLITDDLVMDKIYALRENKLPNETGGVLIGSYDRQRKIIYVIDTLPSPPDSEEWPTVYIRGSRGLKGCIKKIQDITMNNLGYVGEWHSHPKRHGCQPSRDDMKAFSWLIEKMDREGLPALMLIAGDRSRYKFYLGKME